MSEIEITRALRIAVAAEYRKLADRIERDEKALFVADNPIGTKQIVVSDLMDETGRQIRIGAVQIKEPTTREPRFDIDESVAIPWVQETWNSAADVVEEVPAMLRLRPQYRLSLIVAAKTALTEGRDLPPGVTVMPSTPSNPVVSWTPAKGVDAGAMLTAMAKRKAIDVPAILALEA